MTEDQWMEYAEAVLASSTITTRFSRGHSVCTNSQVLRRATGFAAWKHDGQMRKGEGLIPYIHHPIEVTSILVEVGEIKDLDLLQAALLHDTIEDTETMTGELEDHFGNRICGFVLEVTDDKSLDKQQRKELQIEHAPQLSNEAQTIKLADKISNVIDVAFSKPIDWPLERQLEYFDWADRVVDGLRGCNAALEALFDKKVEESRREVGH